MMPYDDETIFEPSRGGGEARPALADAMVLDNEYQLVEQAGRGGMGVVWKAREIVTGRYVALKFIPEDVMHFDAAMRNVKEAFTRVHDLHHQYICPLYVLKHHRQFGYYLVMQWLEGQSLKEYVRRADPDKQGMKPEEVVRLLAPVAQALDYSHENGILHRDVKPSNIFIHRPDGKKPRVLLIDFDLAARLEIYQLEDYQATSASGTRPYMSPEQWQGKPLTPATDQYALAVTVYQMLAGHLPFSSRDAATLRTTVLRDVPQPIPHLSAGTNAVLQKSLSKKSGERFSSCTRFIRELVKALKASPPPVTPTVTAPVSVVAVPPLPASSLTAVSLPLPVSPPPLPMVNEATHAEPSLQENEISAHEDNALPHFPPPKPEELGLLGNIFVILIVCVLPPAIFSWFTAPGGKYLFTAGINIACWFVGVMVFGVWVQSTEKK